MDFIADAAPDDFDKTRTEFAPSEYGHVSGEHLRLSYEEWHYGKRAIVLGWAIGDVRRNETERRAGFNEFVEWLLHHRDTIRARLVSVGKWNETLFPPLLQREFIEWCWNPANSFRQNANQAIHEPTPADVAEAFRKQAARVSSPVREQLMTLQNLYTSGVIKSLRRN